MSPGEEGTVCKFHSYLKGVETQKEPNESNTKLTRDPQTLKASALALDFPPTTPKGTSLHLQGISSTWYPSAVCLPGLHTFALKFLIALLSQEPRDT